MSAASVMHDAPPTGALTVFIVDDDPSVRMAIHRLLESVDLPCEVFANAPDFLKRAERGVDGCVILDVRMPGPSGLDLQRSLAEMGVELPIVFVTAYADVPLTVRAMKAGAVEVLTKPFDDQALIDVVNSALERARLQRQDREETTRLRALLERLTPREREVMALVVTGLQNKQVAQQLGTTERTIKAHRAQVMHKMQAESLAELVRMSDRLGVARPH